MLESSKFLSLLTFFISLIGLHFYSRYKTMKKESNEAKRKELELSADEIRKNYAKLPLDIVIDNANRRIRDKKD